MKRPNTSVQLENNQPAPQNKTPTEIPKLKKFFLYDNF